MIAKIMGAVATYLYIFGYVCLLGLLAVGASVFVAIGRFCERSFDRLELKLRAKLENNEPGDPPRQ